MKAYSSKTMGFFEKPLIVRTLVKKVSLNFEQYEIPNNPLHSSFGGASFQNKCVDSCGSPCILQSVENVAVVGGGEDEVKTSTEGVSAAFVRSSPSSSPSSSFEY